jgi:UDP-2-acetamido-3-amino-2,3-dideoxy-glucuronate N-acetyltransferase
VTVEVHPQGLCESDCVGDGTRIWAFAHVLQGAVVGKDCNVCDHVFIEGGAVLGDRVTVKNAVLLWDGVTIEDDVFVGPAVVFTNDLRPRRNDRAFTPVQTVVRRGASLGASVTVVCGTEIGTYAFAAAGSVVTQDVPPYTWVAGVPATVRGFVCSCGAALGTDLVCSCGLRYERADAGLVALDAASPKAST